MAGAGWTSVSGTRREGEGSPVWHDDGVVVATYARTVLAPIATAWIPAVVGVTVPALALLFIWLIALLSRRRGSDETDDSDGGGGLSTRRPPRRPPPVGPVDWPDFERQFAAYVAGRPERSATHARARAVDDCRAICVRGADWRGA